MPIVCIFFRLPSEPGWIGGQDSPATHAALLDVFFTTLAVSHTVIPEASDSSSGFDVRYQAESPDEAALVEVSLFVCSHYLRYLCSLALACILMLHLVIALHRNIGIGRCRGGLQAAQPRRQSFSHRAKGSKTRIRGFIRFTSIFSLDRRGWGGATQTAPEGLYLIDKASDFTAYPHLTPLIFL